MSQPILAVKVSKNVIFDEILFPYLASNLAMNAVTNPSIIVLRLVVNVVVVVVGSVVVAGSVVVEALVMVSFTTLLQYLFMSTMMAQTL